MNLLILGGIRIKICRNRIRGQFRKQNLINAHVPSEERNSIIKATFYEELGNILEKIPKFDIKYILGDVLKRREK